MPEQLFSTEDNPAEGISAVKAIALAQADGQRVYTINTGNLDAALTAVNAAPEIESEIRNAVNAGKEVTIHQSPINHYGWSGHGYIIIDPETGAGAYKISGGANGGSLLNIVGGIAVGVLGTFFAFKVAVLFGLIILAAFMIDFLVLLYQMESSDSFDDYESIMMSANLMIMIGAIGLWPIWQAAAPEGLVLIAFVTWFATMFGAAFSL